MIGQVYALTVDGDTVDVDEDVDYEVSYEDNVEVGTAKVIVEGRGEFAGKVIREFEIKEAPKNSWKSMDEQWYYFDKDGKLEKDAYRKEYYLDENGVWNGKEAAPGWTKVGSRWRYATSRKTWLKDG